MPSTAHPLFTDAVNGDLAEGDILQVIAGELKGREATFIGRITGPAFEVVIDGAAYYLPPEVLAR